VPQGSDECNSDFTITESEDDSTKIRHSQLQLTAGHNQEWFAPKVLHKQKVFRFDNKNDVEMNLRNPLIHYLFFQVF